MAVGLGFALLYIVNNINGLWGLGEQGWTIWGINKSGIASSPPPST